ncbi:hypothetical protein [Candidatus Trichorickettsia mobilis]|uniref:hypothetical protein n=1 Tax=Candidatus Trichorickettsia mobilis TaxID=1346319 RepID=UPI00292CF7BB|nr:hypothetical protein [Candidatus Trichorickettsia mobilis]
MHKHKSNVTKLHKSRIKKIASTDINIDEEDQEMVQEEVFSLPNTMKVRSVDDNSSESLAVSGNIRLPHKLKHESEGGAEPRPAAYVCFVSDSSTTQKHKSSAEVEFVRKSILKCDIIEGVNKVVNNYTQVTNNTIDKLVDDANINIYFAKEVLSACTTMFDHAIQENMIISKDMLQLRDVSDVLNFQRKVVSESFNNFADLFLNISNIGQNLINKKMENSASFVDKHIK